jgi:hypothetical protein
MRAYEFQISSGRGFQPKIFHLFPLACHIHNSFYILSLNPSSRQPHKVFTPLLQRGATEHSSTRPRLPSYHLLNVSLQLANKFWNKKNMPTVNDCNNPCDIWQLATCFHSSILIGLFDLEDEGDMFLRNVRWLSTDYAALYARTTAVRTSAHHCTSIEDETKFK